MRGMNGKHKQCREKTLIFFDFLELGDLPTVSARIFMVLFLPTCPPGSLPPMNGHLQRSLGAKLLYVLSVK